MVLPQPDQLDIFGLEVDSQRNLSRATVNVDSKQERSEEGAWTWCPPPSYSLLLSAVISFGLCLLDLFGAQCFYRIYRCGATSWDEAGQQR